MKNKSEKRLKKLAEKLRKIALKKGTAELDQYKLLAAFNCLLGRFREAGQYQFQYNMVTGNLVGCNDSEGDGGTKT